MRKRSGKKRHRHQRSREIIILTSFVPNDDKPHQRRRDRENNSANRQRATATRFEIRAARQTQNARHRDGQSGQQNARFKLAEIAEQNYADPEQRAERDRRDKQIKKKLF